MRDFIEYLDAFLGLNGEIFGTYSACSRVFIHDTVGYSR